MTNPRELSHLEIRVLGACAGYAVKLPYDKEHKAATQRFVDLALIERIRLNDKPTTTATKRGHEAYRQVVEALGVKLPPLGQAPMVSSLDGQPPPKPNSHPAVWDLAIKDIHERDAVGQARYGVRLQPHNGRDALKDAYAEALDTVVYIRQAIYERDGA